MQQEELIKKLNNKSILIKVNHIKTLQYQQCTYTPIEFEIVKGV